MIEQATFQVDIETLWGIYELGRPRLLHGTSSRKLCSFLVFQLFRFDGCGLAHFSGHCSKRLKTVHTTTSCS